MIYIKKFNESLQKECDLDEYVFLELESFSKNDISIIKKFCKKNNLKFNEPSGKFLRRLGISEKYEERPLKCEIRKGTDEYYYVRPSRENYICVIKCDQIDGLVDYLHKIFVDNILGYDAGIP